MRRLAQLSLVLVILLFASIGWSATYYIDWQNGDDANDGLTKSSPWKRAPGMRGCTANCLQKQQAGGKPGDQFILKGGVIWPREAISWDWYFGSGTQSNPIYFGVDQTWYSGGSWSRPVLDAEGGVPNVSPERVKAMMRLYGNWLVADNIEFKGLAQLNDTDPTVPVMLALGPGNCAAEVKNCYFHGWSHGGTATKDNMIVVNAPLINEGPDMNMKIHDNVWDGGDTTQDMAMAFKGSAGHIYNNYVAYMRNGILGSSLYVWGNSFINIARSFDPTSHGNVVESTGGRLIIYNNFISNSSGGATIFHTPKDGDIDYCFNNVIISQRNQAIQIDNNGLATGNGAGIYVFNNTIQSPEVFSQRPINGPSRSAYPNLPFMTVQNNYLIADYPVVNFGSKVLDKMESNTIGHTNSQATSSGYAEIGAYPFAPLSGSGITVGSGLNLGGLCSGIPSLAPSNASIACTDDTIVGVAYNVALHIVTGPNRAAKPRVFWSVGAYEGDRTQRIYAPGNLRFAE